MRRSALLLVALLLCLAAPSAAQDGRTLYAEHCASCHGGDLQGGPDAPSLRTAGPAAVDFYLSTGRMPAAISQKEAPSLGRPSFSRAEMDALIAYISSREPAGPPIPHVTLVDDVRRARSLYEEDCQACHGVYGTGAVVGFGWIAPALYEATPTQIAEAVRVGPGMMPRFNADEIPPRDLDALVSYVLSLRTTTFDPGGWEIGRLGPVTEGFVAWILGLGSLLAVARYLGTAL